MSEFRTCASPGCTACQEVRRLRERLAAVEALCDEWTAKPGLFAPQDLRAALGGTE